MNAPLDITGQRFGKLIAIKRVRNRGRRTWWRFRCKCGQFCLRGFEGIQAAKRKGFVSCCDICFSKAIGERSFKHGHKINRTHTRTYKAWQHAKSRCYSKTDPKYPIYGRRGITMCKRWRDSFINFLADMGECPKGLTLGRIDNDKGYSRHNCEWQTPHQQARAMRKNVWITYRGRRYILKDFADLIGANYKRLSFLNRSRKSNRLTFSQVVKPGYFLA